MNELLVNARGIAKTFHSRSGEVQALRHLDLQLRPGQVMALLGSNGAGKSTALEIILGLIRPTSGLVSVLGTTPTKAMHSGGVSALMQNGGLLPSLTVADTLKVIAALHGQSAKLPQVIESTGLEPLLKRRVGKCSGGELQRLRLAMALIPNPELLILDEPTAGMDPHAMREFWRLVIKQVQTGTALIFATHYLTEAERYAQNLLIMHDGQVLASGTPTSVKATENAATLEDAFFNITDRACCGTGFTDSNPTGVPSAAPTVGVEAQRGRALGK